MSSQALRRLVAAVAPLRRGTARSVIGKSQQGLLLAPAAIRPSSSGVVASAAAAELRGAFQPWTIASRMSSSAREVGRADVDSGLISILRAELEHEKKTYSQPKELSRGPPKPWTLTDKPGNADVILRRTYGTEDIAVTCVYQPDSYGENEGEDFSGNSEDERDDQESTGGASCVNMTITITKGSDTSRTLEISAASYGSEVTIENVYFWEDKDSKESLYEGPNFLQLDEEVQSQFEKFIKARGVNSDLTGYLFTILADKEQREYMRWLQKVEDFLKH